MAGGFGRSNSLSINTNTGSSTLFGNTASSGQQSAGLFGTASQPQTGGLFGGASSQPQTGGLFAGAAAATSQPQPGSSLFGGQQTSQPASGGLFANASKPATGATGSLFGGPTQSQPQQSGGLFGGALGANTQQNQQTSQSGGLFGQPQKSGLLGPQQQTSTPSLFGNTTTTQNQAPTPSLFGSTQQTQPQQNSLFGGMASQNRPLGATGPTLSSTQQPVQMQDFSSIKGTTRYSDLSKDLQDQIQEIDTKIHNFIDASSQVRATMPAHGERLATVAPDVAYIEEFLSTIETGIHNDATVVAKLSEVNKADAADALRTFRGVDNLLLPQQFHYGNASLNGKMAPRPATSVQLEGEDEDPNKPVDLTGYFSKRAEGLGHTLDTYQSHIREIEAHLRTMEYGLQHRAQELSGSRNSERDRRRELVDALKAIEGAILDTAKKVGQTRDAVTQQTLGSVGAGIL